MQINSDNSLDKKDINALIFMMEGLDEPWGMKDVASRHIYMNAAALIYTNTPPNFAIEGKLDAEFPVSWSELHEALKQHDLLTQNSARRVAVIETHCWNGASSMSPYISEKTPIYDKHKQCIGIMWKADSTPKCNAKPPFLTLQIPPRVV